MNNCLKTQLKGVVNNNTLDYLDCITVDVSQVENPNYNKRNLYLRCVSPGITIKVVSGDMFFTNSSGSSNLGTEITISEDNVDLFFSNDNGRVIITNKKNVTYVKANTGSVGFGIKVSNMDYMGSDEAPVKLSAYNTAFGELPKNTVFNYISVGNSTSLKGDISKLNISHCTDILVNDTLIVGTLTQVPSTLNYLNISNCNVEFNANILSSSNVRRFNGSSNPGVTGIFANMSNGKYTEISVRDTGVTGSVESFVEAEWQGERRTSETSDPLTLVIGNLISFHEVYLPLRYLYVEFGASNVKVYNSNSSGSKLDELATYDGSDWSYV